MIACLHAIKEQWNCLESIFKHESASRLAMTELFEQKMRDAGNASRRPSWWHALLLLPFLIGAVFLLYEWVLYRNAATRQQTTFGTVTAHEPANHSRYGYTFTVEGRRYDGWQVPHDSEEWRVGQQVVVYYDAADPARNALRDFTTESDGIIAPVPVLVLGIVTAVLLIISLRRRAGPRQSPG
jgi:hypothetical protein